MKPAANEKELQTLKRNIQQVSIYEENMMTKMEEKPLLKLLTVSEAAQELRVSRWMIYELIRTKQLKTLTIATRRLIATDDLESFIIKCKEQQYEA